MDEKGHNTRLPLDLGYIARPAQAFIALGTIELDFGARGVEFFACLLEVPAGAAEV